jgi:hypothetical protein
MDGCVHVLNNIEVKKVYHNGSKAKTTTWRQFLKTVEVKSDAHVLNQDIKETNWLEVIVGYDRLKAGSAGKPIMASSRAWWTRNNAVQASSSTA